MVKASLTLSGFIAYKDSRAHLAAILARVPSQDDWHACQVIAANLASSVEAFKNAVPVINVIKCASLARVPSGVFGCRGAFFARFSHLEGHLRAKPLMAKKKKNVVGATYNIYLIYINIYIWDY